MKVRIILLTVMFLLVSSTAAQAHPYYYKHKHGNKTHWHKKAGVNPPLGSHPVTQYLYKKHSKAYKPTHRGYTRKEFNLLAKRAGWPKKHWKKLYRVATCESGRRWKPSNGHYVGLMQHNVGNGAMNRKQLENPVLNLMVARWMYKHRGWQPWPVCGKR